MPARGTVAARLRTRVNTVVLFLSLGLLAACNEMQYYRQSMQGQFDIWSQAQDIETLLSGDNLDAEVRNQLRLVLQAREFAGDVLDLSFNDSYTRYVDLNRDYVVKNLYAAEEFSTQLYSWCYPIIGCANYRGYFALAMLNRYRQQLSVQGYDTYVGEVTAYSTLGWFDDPVLSTFVGLPDYRLVGLIFHELAHQQLYIGGDTSFNESFATAVEQAGLEQFYGAGDDAQQLQRYRHYRQRMAAAVNLAAQAREELESLYRQPLSDPTKRRQKEQVLARLQGQFAGLKNHQTPVFNNARLGAMAAYHQYVPAFLNILNSHQRNYPRFYLHVRKLGQLESGQREMCLARWSEFKGAASAPVPAICEA